MRVVRLFTLLVLILAGVSVCMAQSKAVIKPQDNVNVNCEEEPSLSKDYTITRDGYIVMQFIGAIQVAGHTEEAAAAKIGSALLDNRIVNRATVRVKILGAKGQVISYTGALRKPGETLPRPGLRLSDIVEMGEPTGAADLDHVKILATDGKELLVNFNAFDGKNFKNNPELRGGDRVIFELQKATADVTVLGAVARPGAIAYRKGLTIKEAIEQVGGMSELADSDSISVERKNSSLPKVSMSTSAGFELQSGDIVKVGQIASPKFITIMGAVATPQRMVFKEGMMLSEVINQAGGGLANANLTNVKVTRTGGGSQKATRHNLKAVGNGVSGDIPMQAGDVVEVPAIEPPKRKTNELLRIAGAVLLGFGLGIIKF